MSVDRTAFSKHIRTQLSTSDLPVSGELDCGPPLGIQEHLVAEPIRNGLLGHGLLAEVTHAIGESALAPSNLNSSLKSGNVVLLHEAEPYTRKLVTVNKNRCLASDKEACTVLLMPNTKRKLVPVAKPSKADGTQKKRKPLEVGPDNRTLPQRLHWLMGQNGVSQAGLARMCSEYYATFVPDCQDKVKQQHIFNVLQGQESSSILPLIAQVFDVSDMWLQYGIGPMERAKH